MKSLMLSKTWLVVIGMIALLSACNKNDTTEAEVETYVEETVYRIQETGNCLLYTSDAADERSSVDLGGRRIIKKKNNTEADERRSIENTKSKK